MITLEQFDINKFTTEKVGFQIHETVFNVSEGNGIEDGLRDSSLWRHHHTNEVLRQRFWNEIQKYIPQFQSGKFGTLDNIKPPRNYKGWYFVQLLMIVSALKKYQNIKLIYISDRSHAELIQRCVEWLSTQIAD